MFLLIAKDVCHNFGALEYIFFYFYYFFMYFSIIPACREFLIVIFCMFKKIGCVWKNQIFFFFNRPENTGQMKLIY